MKYVPLKIYSVTIFVLLLLSSCRSNEKHITIIETTDIHGVILPYDFIEKEKLNASMANSASFIKTMRNERDAVFLLDDGDNLQEQPQVYYYNFIDTVSPHFLAEAMNWLKYDAVTAGNHDIETGHNVYDRLVNEYNFPLLAANAVDKKTGKPYFKPYVILEKDKVRIAVFGLVTPTISTTIPEVLYSGIEFRNMVKTARLWMPEILAQKPDLVVGLFHSGWDSKNEVYQKPDSSGDDGSSAVAYNVPGFDIIFNGHDHRLANEKFVNSSGDTLLILNGGCRSENVAVAEIVLSSKKKHGVKHKTLEGKILEVKDFAPDPDFINKFKPEEEKIAGYVNKVIGFSNVSVSTRDSYFGPSAFVDMIHGMQLEITGADISFAAPLSFDVRIPEGPITVGDMFKLYRYENMLYTMSLSGKEILKYLEFSYAGWFNTMNGPDDYLLKFRTGIDGKPIINKGRAFLKNQFYNFDSAAGIDYTVDVSKPEGERIIIKSLADGRMFEKDKYYNVAVNSFRGSGGGGHFIEGVGLAGDALRSRIVASTDRDLRYFMLKSIQEKKEINPVSFNTWKIVPEDWVKNAVSNEYQLLFGMSKTSYEVQINKTK